jgi:hypothetical protein
MFSYEHKRAHSVSLTVHRLAVQLDNIIISKKVTVTFLLSLPTWPGSGTPRTLTSDAQKSKIKKTTSIEENKWKVK